MSRTCNSETGCFDIAMHHLNSSSQLNLTSGENGTYRSSVGYTNESFQNNNCNGKMEDNMEKSTKRESHVGEIKTFKRRFIMLFLTSFCSLMNGVPQFQYTVVADIISCYYDISLNQVNLTCIVFMAVFIPLVFPVMYFMDKKGLRYTVLTGGFLNLLGGCIQCASFATDRYGVIMLSQTIYAVGQVFLLSLPPFISGVWFGANEVGLACAFGVFGNQLGIALGFMIPPVLISNNCTDQKDITYELSVIAYPIVAVNTVIFLILLLAFQEKPRLFPSMAQAAKNTAENPNYLQSLKNLFKSVPYILLLISYGIITGTYFAMSTIMNEMVLIHFPGAEEDAGWMGAVMVFTGMVGSIVLGTILDRTHRFKEVSVATFAISLILIAMYSFLIMFVSTMWVQFLFFSLLGFFTAGYLPAGFDFAAEITYPEPEAMSGSLLNASCQVFSIIITYVSSKLIEVYGDGASNSFFCACLLLGTIITACIRCDMKRANAQ